MPYQSFLVGLVSHLNILHPSLSSSRLSNTRCSNACLQCKLYLERYRLKKAKYQQKKTRNGDTKKTKCTPNITWSFLFQAFETEALVAVKVRTVIMCALRVYVKDHKHIIWRRWFICLFISFIEFLVDRIHYSLLI